MKKDLGQLKRLLVEGVKGVTKSELFDPGISCSGLLVKAVREGLQNGISEVESVKGVMDGLCGGGLNCDKCEVYQVMLTFVSEVELELDPSRVVDGRIDMRVNIKGLNENQLTEIYNALSKWEEIIWADTEKEDIEGEAQVELYNRVRMVEQLQGVIKEYFK